MADAAATSVEAIRTIGYERATLPAVLKALKASGVALLVDVRAVAASRRPGFSKTMLSASLEAEGIAYRHLRALGTPKAGRDAAKKGRIDEMHAIFAEQLATPEAQDAFALLSALVQTTPTALRCYEAEAAVCHRRILTDRLVAATGQPVQDLMAADP